MKNAQFISPDSRWLLLVLLVVTALSPHPTRAQDGDSLMLSMTCPADTTISCNDSQDPEFTGTPLVNDPNATVTFSDFVLPNYPTGCPEDETVVRFWVAVNDDGDTVTCEQIISVFDRTPPVLQCPPPVSIPAGGSIDPAIIGEAEIIDDCHEIINVSYSDVLAAGVYPVEQTISRTWIAVDACGNTGECVQQIDQLAAGVTASATTLSQSRPNPFHPGAGGKVYIDFYLAVAGDVDLCIYDIVGRKLIDLIDGYFPSGPQTVEWDGHDAEGSAVPAGVYLYRLKIGDETKMKKLAIIR